MYDFDEIEKLDNDVSVAIDKAGVHESIYHRLIRIPVLVKMLTGV